MIEMKLYPLGEVCDIVGGGTPSKSKKEYYGGHIPWATVRDMNAPILNSTEHSITEQGLRESSSNLIEEGNVIIATRVGLGKVCLLAQPTAINQDLKAVIPKEGHEIDKMYLLRWFQSMGKTIIDHGTGATVQGVKIPFIKSLKIPLPPLPEQKRIVAILDQAFEAIDQAQANIERNVKNAEELFQSKLNEVFGQGGERWQELTVNEVCTLLNGRAYKKSELLSEGKYRVLRVGNFFTNKHWYYSDLELPDKNYCDSGDLLYAWSASFGPRIWNEEKVIYHYHIWKVIPHHEKVERDFLFWLFEWDKEKIKAEQGAGTTMVHVSKASMEKRILPIAPIELQQEICDKIETLSKETKTILDLYNTRKTCIEELKSAFLGRAFSSELTTKEVVV